ncbi:MAG: PEP-CTERM system TPR-repeat protein PrsT [Gammaproteobacteria bacterium]|nr:PEP-CTERM system TPR-repeat protein PrsT [Gammaproteobacteria bacterium]
MITTIPSRPRPQPRHALMLTVALMAACSKSSGGADLASIRTSFSGGDLATAEVQAKQFLKSEPENPEGRFLLGQIYLANEVAKAAQGEFERAQRNGLPLPQVAASLGRAYALGGDCDKLDALVSTSLTPEAFAALPAADRATLTSARGDCAAGGRAWQTARERFDQALAQDPKCLDAMVGLARLSAQQDASKAMAWLNKAIAIDPKYAPALSLLGDAQRIQGDLSAAEDYYTKAIAARPNNAYELLSRAVVRLARNENEKADGDIAAAAQKVDNNHPYVEYVKGLSALLKGANEDARTAFETALARYDQHGPSMLYLAVVLLRQDKLEQAEQYANKAAVAMPFLREAKLLLAVVQARKQDYKAGMATLQSVTGADTLGKMAAALNSALESGDAQQVAAEVARGERQGATLPASFVQIGLGTVVPSTTEETAAEAPAETSSSTDDKHLDAARALERGDTDKAMSLLNALLSADPKDALTHNLLGMANQQRGAADKAREAFQRALALKPDFGEATNNLALSFVAEGKLDEARAVVADGLKQNPKHIGLLMVLAEIDRRRGDLAATEATLRQVLALQPKVAGPRLSLYSLLAAAKRNDEAIATLEEGLAMVPKQGEFARQLATAYMRAERPKDAVAVLGKLAQSNPKDDEVQFALAQAQAATGDEDATEAALRRALDIEPFRIAPALALARLELKRGKLAEAAALVDRMVKSDPGNADAVYLQGQVRLAQGDATNAVVSLNQAYKLRPSLPTAVGLAQAHAAAGHTGEGRAVLEGFVAERPKDPPSLYTLGEFLLRAADEPAAIEVFKRLLAVEPTNTVAMNNLAWLLREKAPAEALDYARQALAREPNQPAVMDTMAVILAQQGKHEEAFGLWDKVIKASPDNPTYQLHQAEALLGAKRNAEAKALLEKMLERKPNEALTKAVKELLART